MTAINSKPQTKLTNATRYVYDGDDLGAMAKVNNYYEWVVDMINSDIGSQILEVGAGTGNFTKILLDRFPKSKIKSIEPTESVFEQLSSNQAINKNNQLTIAKGDLSIIPDNQTFDTIIYNNVMEHVENDTKEMQDIFLKLNKGGKLIMFSPAIPWLMSDFDRSIGHYRRYTLEDKVLKARQAGFDIITAYYVDFPGAFVWFLFIKIFKIRLNGENAGLYDKLIVPLLRIWDPAKLFKFGKNVLVIAQK